MGRYPIHQTDANADVLIKAMHDAGASVERLGRPVDVLVSIAGVCGVAELKTSKGKLRPSQVKFFARFQGPSAVVRTAQEAVEFVRALQGLHGSFPRTLEGASAARRRAGQP